METTLQAPRPRGLALMFGWKRLMVLAIVGGLVGFVIAHGYPTTPRYVIVVRELIVGLVALIAFGVVEQWPRRLPSWIARWPLQVAAVAFVIPWTVMVIYAVTTTPDMAPFWKSGPRQNGFLLMMMSSLLVAPWTAVAALVRQKEFAAKSQALAFELEKSELERRALDSRLRLLQAQVEPHFLFNTLANVRELVVSGSPQASAVLDNLIEYLRAAVPRLHDPLTTVGQEVKLVRAYLELMHLRMPDRLAFDLQVDAAAVDLHCPPTTLLTLVENAIRHGIDPAEQGGRIDVWLQVEGGRCCAQVSDTGAGLGAGAQGLGTGLATLRERLELVFGGDATLTVVPLSPRGTRARVEFPVRKASA